MKQPMLARQGELIFNKPILAQPKIDGVRAIWNPETQTLHTRNGRRITSCTYLESAIKDYHLSHLPLDGELCHADLSFQKLNGLINQKKTTDEHSNIQFHIFDLMDEGSKQSKRIAKLNAYAGRGIWRFVKFFFTDNPPQTLSGKPVLNFVETKVVRSQKQLDRYYDEYLKAGYEGMIMRYPEATYKNYRAHCLKKIKPVYDCEAKLIGFEPATTHLHKNTFGSLILELAGQRFKCSGMSEETRWELWQDKPIGADITVEYGDMTDRGVPRFPRFKAVRYDLATA